VWRALSEEEVAATVSGLQEMGLYHLPYDDELILRIIRNPTNYEEVRGLRDHELFSWDWVIVCHRREPAPDFNMECHGPTGSADSPTVPVPFERLPPEYER
jgi:hypothetical protein